MRICYYALKPIQVGDEVREIGDLIPEALTWPYLSGYITEGKIAPVLIATLPEEQQMMLLEWEEEVANAERGDVVVAAPVAPAPEPKPVTLDPEPKPVDPDTDPSVKQSTQKVSVSK